MQTKEDIYAELIEPLVRKIGDICEENDIPALVAICLDSQRLEKGNMEMTMAGFVHLEPHMEVPQPMMLAATILRIPGFDVHVRSASVSSEVH